MLKASQLVHDFGHQEYQYRHAKSINSSINDNQCQCQFIIGCEVMQGKCISWQNKLIPGLVEMESWINPRTKRWRPWQMILCVAWWNSDQYYIRLWIYLDSIEPLPKILHKSHSKIIQVNLRTSTIIYKSISSENCLLLYGLYFYCSSIFCMTNLLIASRKNLQSTDLRHPLDSVTQSWISLRQSTSIVPLCLHFCHSLLTGWVWGLGLSKQSHGAAVWICMAISSAVDDLNEIGVWRSVAKSCITKVITCVYRLH